MSGKRFRTALFGFNKADVCDYIRELDERADKNLSDKNAEISSLRQEMNILREQRESIVTVLQTAEKNARDIVDGAKKDADEIRQNTDKEINEKKVLLNREIEIKRREIKNSYAAENKKIAKLRNEVNKMRIASIEAIKKFEEELSQVEAMSSVRSSLIETVLEGQNMSNMPAGFSDAVRSIPVQDVSGSDSNE